MKTWMGVCLLEWCHWWLKFFAFSYASSYIFFVNMTTSIMFSNSMILSASRKWMIPHLHCDLSTAVSEYSSAFGSLSALSCLRSFINSSAAWELKHILDISLFQIWGSFSLSFIAEHKNVSISCCLGNHQCHRLLQIRAPASSHWQRPLVYYSTPTQAQLWMSKALTLQCTRVVTIQPTNKWNYYAWNCQIRRACCITYWKRKHFCHFQHLTYRLLVYA